MKEFLIVIEKTDTGYSSFSPDLPGCIATGATREEVQKNMKEAVEFHVEGLKMEGHTVPFPEAYSMYIKLSA
jgi:predicted RNase H-like HicB family nuclease